MMIEHQIHGHEKPLRILQKVLLVDERQFQTVLGPRGVKLEKNLLPEEMKSHRLNLLREGIREVQSRSLLQLMVSM